MVREKRKAEKPAGMMLSSRPSGPAVVAAHLEKARQACLAAVETYNKPGRAFRTRTYTILMVVAWTALFHAIFHQRGRKPWQKGGPAEKYKTIDGEPMHWGLGECVRQYYGEKQSAQRKNLEFMRQLRNKIEHRDHPELDPDLYGECQAMLMNFEELLTDEFGADHAIAGQLTVALQFSSLRPDAQIEALRRLDASSAPDLVDFISKFRDGLPREVMDSPSYSFRVFLVPKLANREGSADLAVEFVPYDSTHPEKMERLRRVVALIKDKHISVASEDLILPSAVVERVKECVPFRFNMHTHTNAWKYYKVRPREGSQRPQNTNERYCIYDALAKKYGYKEAWVKYLCEKLRDPEEYERVKSAQAVPKESAGPYGSAG